MILSIYAICKNEQLKIKEFLDYHLKELRTTDYFVLLDTGSTDDTFKIISEYSKKFKNIIVKQEIINPWRFDTARNNCLSLVPANVDICVSLDIDEKLSENWREEIENNFDPLLNKLHFPYVYSWDPNIKDMPKSAAYEEKVHSRNEYKWIHLVHESLQYIGTNKERRKIVEKPILYHYPDENKKRNYLELCKKSAEEEPNDPWVSNYYAQELRLSGKIEDSINESKRLLTITNNYYSNDNYEKNEVSVIKNLRSSICSEISDMYISEQNNILAFNYIMKAIGEYPNNRDVWIKLAEHLIAINKKDFALECIILGESFNEKGCSVTYKYWDPNYLTSLKLECLTSNAAKKAFEEDSKHFNS